ncbi:IS3 family transposase [Flavobacterium ustbae]|uniref:IS3 family transposase n=1 Tax=Flavobacterium ustbae TaxID=2488790 RepID=UPI001F3BA867|nr:IS3 family transposase [Flavobacterium ustbae]
MVIESKGEGMEKNKIYDRDFKVNAVKLALKSNRFKVAKELGIAITNIYRWQAEFQKYGADSFCGVNNFRTPEQKKNSELKRILKQKLKDTELEIEIFKSASNYILEGRLMIFHFIENNLDRYRLYRMCKVLGTSQLAYYNWRNKILTPKQMQTIFIEKEITSVFYEYKQRYGNAKISAELKSRGIKISVSKVTSHMKKLGLVSKRSVKHKIKSSSPFVPYNPYIFPHLLNSPFKVEETSQVWVSGIASVETNEQLLFLTIIMDLFDRKIIGWSLSDGLTTKETSLASWEMAVRTRKTKKGLIFHSDRSPQYANNLFTRKLKSFKGVMRSMSRTGNRLDNVSVKSFFVSLKSELVNLNANLTKGEMEERIVRYINTKH